jgi:hypothetical protein
MMVKKLQILVLSFCLISSVFSASVNVDKARIIANNFYTEKALTFNNGIGLNSLSLSEVIIKSEENINYYYVFTFSGQGFIIISAEDVLPPVLGYSFSSSYCDKDQPDSYRNFMQTYADEILFIRQNNIQQTPEIKDMWDHYQAANFAAQSKSGGSKSLDPLIPSRWNQSYPYNYYCPEDAGGSGGHVYAGCVATAMSQVMYYWRYPLQGTGSHSYYYPPYGNLSANFGETTYEWEGMQNSIDHDNIGPIALLQYHCGIAVDMMYGPNGSGAYSDDVPPALKNYFNYSTDCYFSNKSSHSNSEWVSMLTDNLDNHWPLYYSGYSSSGGHAFVCDGYQDDYFHFNFGWSGQSDGYYSLTNVGGFSSGQGAIFDCYPGTGYPYFWTGDHAVTQISGSIDDGSGPIENYNNNTTCTWLFSPQTSEDSISNITITFKSFETEANDKVRIYDGSSTQDNLLGEFSGSTIPGTITTTSNEMLVTFQSDGSGTASGWLAEFSANRPDYCTGVIILDEASGNLTDGSGTFNYHNSSVCMWKIIPDQAQSVTLNFTAFNTEDLNDRVRIYDLESQELLAQYSGSYSGGNMPDPVTSPSGKMFIAFSTNSSQTSEGWNAYYTTVLTGSEESLEGNGVVKIFPNPASSRLNIELPALQNDSYKIQLMNVTGERVYKQIFESTDNLNTLQISTSDLPEGIYFVQITSPTDTKTEKVIIQ